MTHPLLPDVTRTCSRRAFAAWAKRGWVDADAAAPAAPAPKPKGDAKAPPAESPAVAVDAPTSAQDDTPDQED